MREEKKETSRDKQFTKVHNNLIECSIYTSHLIMVKNVRLSTYSSFALRALMM